MRIRGASAPDLWSFVENMEESELSKIKEVVEELLHKMTLSVLDVAVGHFLIEGDQSKDAKDAKDALKINITIEDPQMLIGHNGQTLGEFERLLKIICNKKIKNLRAGFRDIGDDQLKTVPSQSDFYIAVDINDYKAKKVQFLKNLAITSADQAVLTKEKKVLPPMPSYERRIIHEQLAQRQDVITESIGEGIERSVVIKPVS